MSVRVYPFCFPKIIIREIIKRALLKSLPLLLKPLAGDYSELPILHSFKSFAWGCRAKSDLGINNYLRADIEQELEEQEQKRLAEILEKENQRKEKERLCELQKLSEAIIGSKTPFQELEEDKKNQVLKYVIDSQTPVTITVQEWTFKTKEPSIEIFMNKK